MPSSAKLRKSSRLINVLSNRQNRHPGNSRISSLKKEMRRIKHKNEIDPGVQQAFLYAGFFHVIYSINLILSREKLKISVLLITDYLFNRQYTNGILRPYGYGKRCQSSTTSCRINIFLRSLSQQARTGDRNRAESPVPMTPPYPLTWLKKQSLIFYRFHGPEQFHKVSLFYFFFSSTLPPVSKGRILIVTYVFLRRKEA